MDKKKDIKLIAYYLPQFHPIPENNQWHGMGFTEWTNVGRAKPLFKGHDQPRVPADLGYYDLRLPTVRQQQAEMAAKYGITGFCYWHYWFGNGRRLLEMPFNEVVASGEPNFPFCLAWANESWKGVWHGLSKGKMLIEQVYPGKSDYIDHFNTLLTAFKDPRYMKIAGKPIFVVYMPFQIPDFNVMRDVWVDLAIKNGLNGIYFIAHTVDKNALDTLFSMGYDAVNLVRLYGIRDVKRITLLDKIWHKVDKRHRHIFPYSEAIKYFAGGEDSLERCYPTLIPNWDHSPRSGERAYVLTDSTPKLFGRHVRSTFEHIQHKADAHQVVFVKSWNEWGESNYLEPDLTYGKQYLEVLKKEITRFNNGS